MVVEVPLNQRIGARLRDLREARGIRKERVALELDMSAQNWALYEAGKQKLTVTMLPTIAEVFGLTVADLVVALFDLREICDNQDISAKAMPDKGSANYNYTDDAGWLSPHRKRVPAGLSLAMAG